jgi:hypothetical protein
MEPNAASGQKVRRARALNDPMAYRCDPSHSKFCITWICLGRVGFVACRLGRVGLGFGACRFGACRFGACRLFCSGRWHALTGVSGT